MRSAFQICEWVHVLSLGHNKGKVFHPHQRVWRNKLFSCYTDEVASRTLLLCLSQDMFWGVFVMSISLSKQKTKNNNTLQFWVDHDIKQNTRYENSRIRNKKRATLMWVLYIPIISYISWNLAFKVKYRYIKINSHCVITWLSLCLCCMRPNLLFLQRLSCCMVRAQTDDLLKLYCLFKGPLFK